MAANLIRQTALKAATIISMSCTSENDCFKLKLSNLKREMKCLPWSPFWKWGRGISDLFLTPKYNSTAQGMGVSFPQRRLFPDGSALLYQDGGTGTLKVGTSKITSLEGRDSRYMHCHHCYNQISFNDVSKQVSEHNPFYVFD